MFKPAQRSKSQAHDCSLIYYFLNDFFLKTMKFKAKEDAEHDYTE